MLKRSAVVLLGIVVFGSPAVAEGPVRKLIKSLTSRDIPTELPTNGSLNTRIGKLKFENGFPSTKSVEALYDELDFQRATQAYLWGLPLVAQAEWRRGHREVLKARNVDYVSYTSAQDKLVILTPNATTPYYMNYANLVETGPLVVVEPVGLTAGGILDMWQRPMVDTGQIGPFKGQGGKFLLLPPGHADLDAPGYHIVRMTTNNSYVAYRVLDPDPAKAKKIVSELQVYRYSQRDNPPKTKVIPFSGKGWVAGQPRGMEYWNRLADIILQEPVDPRDKLMMGMLHELGISKGKKFEPTERQKIILKQAALVGEAMARANAYAKRSEGALVWPKRRWEMALMLTNTTQDTESRIELDERSSWFYEAFGVSEGMMCRTVDAGQCYLESQKDSEGRWFDGSKTYKLTVPPNAPVRQFWSFSVYDNETRTLIETGVRPDVSSRNKLKTNPDGSVDLYFGPKAPKGMESNWVKTIPGRGWFTYFRLYAPTQAFFDRTWTLNDIERFK